MSVYSTSAFYNDQNQLVTATQQAEIQDFTKPRTRGDINSYEAPDQNFPYRTLTYMAVAQLLIGLLLLAVAVIQIFLSPDDRYVFLATSSVTIWTPLPVVATGLVGLCISSNKYWQAHTVTSAFFYLSLLDAVVFMPTLLFVVGILDMYYYQLGSAPNSGDLFQPVTQPSTASPNLGDARHAMVGVYLGLGLLEVVVALITLLVIRCCAKTYKMKDYASNLGGAHNPIPKQFKDEFSAVSKSSRMTVLPAPAPTF